MIARFPYSARILTVLFVQLFALGWMVFERAQIIESGVEIRLPARPVDPRDLFRGHYVRLGYDISQVRLPLIDGSDDFNRNDPVYLLAARSEDGRIEPLSLHREPPAAGPGQVVMAGRVTSSAEALPATLGEERPPCRSPCPTVSITWGIESYFVPKEQALRLEALQRAGQLEILAAVGSDGRAAIKGLIVDGKLVYEEPLF